MSNQKRWRELMEYLYHNPKCTKEDIVKEINKIKRGKEDGR